MISLLGSTVDSRVAEAGISAQLLVEVGFIRSGGARRFHRVTRPAGDRADAAVAGDEELLAERIAGGGGGFGRAVLVPAEALAGAMTVRRVACARAVHQGDGGHHREQRRCPRPRRSGRASRFPGRSACSKICLVGSLAGVPLYGRAASCSFVHDSPRLLPGWRALTTPPRYAALGPPGYSAPTRIFGVAYYLAQPRARARRSASAGTVAARAEPWSAGAVASVRSRMKGAAALGCGPPKIMPARCVRSARQVRRSDAAVGRCVPGVDPRARRRLRFRCRRRGTPSRGRSGATGSPSAGSGSCPIADPASFDWPGPWLAVLRAADGEGCVGAVAFGAPPGIAWSPLGRTGDVRRGGARLPGRARRRRAVGRRRPTVAPRRAGTGRGDRRRAPEAEASMTRVRPRGRATPAAASRATATSISAARSPTPTAAGTTSR